jgi:hypothetical protein
MLALWLGTSALAASPTLHHLLHADSHSPNHVCLITQIKQHPLLATFTPVAAPLPAASTALSNDPVDFKLSHGRDYRTSQSRAPPSVFLPSYQVVG